jgi:hypothetical protein
LWYRQGIVAADVGWHHRSAFLHLCRPARVTVFQLLSGCRAATISHAMIRQPGGPKQREAYMTYLVAITVVHTAISLLAIAVGVFAVIRLFRPDLSAKWTQVFLWTAFLTSATGFIFPFIGFTPAFFTGIVALVVLAAMAVAYRRIDDGPVWRWVYAGGMVASLYLLVFVAVVQAFLKIGYLRQFAPTGTEPPFVIAQVVVLVVLVATAVAAMRLYRPAPGAGPGTGLRSAR